MSLSSQMLRELDRISAIDARKSKVVRDCSVRTEVERQKNERGLGVLIKAGATRISSLIEGFEVKRSEGAKWGAPSSNPRPIAPILLKIASSHSMPTTCTKTQPDIICLRCLERFVFRKETIQL